MRHVLIVLLFVLAGAAEGAGVHTACGNGDFETGLDRNEWSGAFGTIDRMGVVHWQPGSGIQAGKLEQPTAHQTVVDNSAIDLNAMISRVAPGGSTQAVRLGNSASGSGISKLSKTFTVTPDQSIIRFSYALIFEDPAHPAKEQPFFSVQVLDSSGTLIPGLADLGNQASPEKAVADRMNGFFHTRSVPGTLLVYRDWTCAYIDLTSQVGQTVTIEFIVADCSQEGHYGYAYLDNVCASCSNDAEGSVRRYTPRGATVAYPTCGKSRLCFEITMPSIGGSNVVELTLQVFQRGTLLQSVAGDGGSPISAKNYCFDIDPDTIPGLSPHLQFIDFRVIAVFWVNGMTRLAPKITDLEPYPIHCVSQPCLTPIMISNSDFNAGDTGFGSSYERAVETTSGTVVYPRQYAVLTADEARRTASWSLCETSGEFLVVNGATGQAGSRMVWSQTASVEPGKEYRFGAKFRHLPQCNLDVRPRVDLRVNVPGSDVQPSAISTNPALGCHWMSVDRSVVVPAGTSALTAEIWLDESDAGDGNDLAIDDIVLQEMQPADPRFVVVNIASTGVDTSRFHVTATPANGQPLGFGWTVCEVDRQGNCIAGTAVVNPPQWSAPGAAIFAGYNGTSTLTGSAPGVFDASRVYKISYVVFGPCTSMTGSDWLIGFDPGNSRIWVQRTGS